MLLFVEKKSFTLALRAIYLLLGYFARKRVCYIVNTMKIKAKNRFLLTKYRNVFIGIKVFLDIHFISKIFL
jgi:hypothetical protein